MSESAHYTEAANVGRYYLDKTLATDADVIALGQVAATLALAYEQRTANLIAMWSTPESRTEFPDGNVVTWGTGEETTGAFLQQIIERLDVAK